jgi:hypothetical protein
VIEVGSSQTTSKHFLRRAHETDHRLADTRSGVDHQHIEVVADVAERLDQAGMLRRAQVHHALGAGRGRHDADAARALQQHVTQLAAALDDVGQGTFGRQAQQNVDVRQPQVGVQQHDATAKLGQRQGQVH